MSSVQSLQVHDLELEGLKVIELPVHRDDRGWFKEAWNRERLTEAGLPGFLPVQQNMSFNTAVGTTRGFHAEPWDKLITVASGKVFAAWVDLRPGPGFGQLATLQVGPEQAVFVPRGVANAFQTLEPGTTYSYLVTRHWRADDRDGYSYVNLDDDQLAVPWPIPLNRAVISAADREHPSLKRARPVHALPILVLGAGGQLGRALASRSGMDSRLQVMDREALDVSDPAQIDALDLSSYGAVINAAAYTKVDLAELPSGRREAWAVNAQAVSRLVARCARFGTTLVHISTDYVFDGSRPVASEEDQPAPLGVYGQSKAAGEAAVRTLERFYLVRTSWVIGEGMNFVETMKRLAHSDIDPVVVDDQIGRLTFAEDLAAGLLHLIDHRAAYGIYNFQCSGAPQSWYQLARRVFEYCGKDPRRVGATSTSEYGKSRASFAPRPAMSVLDTTKLRATGYHPWDQQRALARYLGFNP
ncbi:dTDP-4-dehydrorhamnose reductase [Glutamicibacter sp. PS]|uniref:dTDP-4-dehydrorhamnose reductase n=1 Tax=Glutamicibacter sp. PS TaxID=3075634 RepID=UPI0028465837|nr:dTDP-4-dehydrorhamnose reductase [Glutamicibacter sp. PS]MDR4533041.1 dTDP-4-dehydrorhamnose reductase [Glutamicibacter sp. PS]